MLLHGRLPWVKWILRLSLYGHVACSVNSFERLCHLLLILNLLNATRHNDNYLILLVYQICGIKVRVWVPVLQLSCAAVYMC